MRILFVCTGNTCRSPMAEGILKKICAENGVEAEVSSAGIAAATGSPPSKNAEKVMKDRGIDISGHVARQITEDDLRLADRIYTMTAGHKAIIDQAAPQYADKVSVLGGGIPDPYGGDEDVYSACADSIEHSIREDLRWITQQR